MKYSLEKLSGLEQKLYFLLEAEDRKIVTSETAIKLLGIKRIHAYVLLNNMQKKGALDKVKANLYIRIPGHIVHDRGKYAEDPIFVAKHLVEPYFISYYTALQLHGLAQQAARQYYLSTTKVTGRVNYHGNEIRAVVLKKARFFGFEKKAYGNEEIIVADLERTILDVLNRPEYAGGYEEILRSFLGLENVDWDRLLVYAERMGETILFNRLGYVLDLLRDSVKTPPSFLTTLEKKAAKHVYYFEAGRKGRLVKRWRLIVDPRLEKISEGV
jgi:predicted transcriptional regulator of viral defense system